MKVTNTPNQLLMETENLSVRIDRDGIRARDNTDEYNLESIFTTSKRGIAKCKQAVSVAMSDDSTLSQICMIIEMYNIKYHRYCGMD